MLDYIEKMLAEAPDEMDGEVPTPAANHLFDIDEDSPSLDEDRAQVFLTFVAKTLFLCKRVRPDLQTAVAFLTTRVRAPSEDNNKKLIRMMQFILATKKDNYLTLSVTSLHTVRWWVDASYAVHPDMKSHTSGTMSLGSSIIYGTSRKPRMNKTISSESEIVSTVVRSYHKCYGRFTSSKRKGTRSMTIYIIPRQQKLNLVGDQWKGVKRKTNPPH